MPFKKVGPNDWVSPSGKHYNAKQIALYHATDGFKHKPKKKTRKRKKAK